jgi:hypothetical protein
VHLTAPSHWSRSVGTGGRDASERVGAITGMRSPAQELPPRLGRTLVNYGTKEPSGRSSRYGEHLSVSRARQWQGAALRHRRRARRFTWAGVEKVSRMEASPDWRPPKEMIDRQPYLPRFMAGGPGNPLGARALYLGNTVYRIHGTNQPSTIGTFVSSGCIRLTNRTSWTSLHPCPCRHAYCGAGGLGAHHGAAGGSGSRAPPPG